MRILFLVLDFVIFAFRSLELFQIVRLIPIPVQASCIVNLYRRGRQCDNANPVGIQSDLSLQNPPKEVPVAMRFIFGAMA